MKKYAIIFVGESNSGGRAENIDALPVELGLQTSVNLLNNETLMIEKLRIGRKIDGGNNLLGHFGFDPDSGWHGWELQLANRARGGAFKDDICYLIKAGQGGSAIAEWQSLAAGSNQDILKKRVQKLQLLVPDITPIIWYSQGINDALLATPTPSRSWIDSTKNSFSNFRLILPNVPILVSEVTPVYTSRNADITTLVSEVPNSYLIPSASVPVTTDINHWPYAGMKSISNLFINKTLELIPSNFYVFEKPSLVQNNSFIRIGKKDKLTKEM
jgi:hypothetical protein